jgi:predicted dehydrogenase
MAIIGATGHTHLVLDELDRFPALDLVAVAPSYAGEELTSYGRLASGLEPRLYASWEHLLTDVKPDLVVVSARHDLTGPIAIRAAQLGCHIISEKPAAQTLDQVALLRRLVSDHGLVYASMLAMRYQPAFYTAWQVVRQGLIGRPALISGQKSYRWGVRPPWYGQRALYGSTINWVGIHLFDLARWIGGCDYVDVYAQHANRVRRERPGCQDVATIQARLANGGCALFHLDYLRPEAAPTHGDDRLRIAGSEGILEIVAGGSRQGGSRLHVMTAQQVVEDWPLAQPGRTLLGDVVAALSGTGELLASAEDALVVSEFAIRATLSADTGRVVDC